MLELIHSQGLLLYLDHAKITKHLKFLNHMNIMQKCTDH